MRRLGFTAVLLLAGTLFAVSRVDVEFGSVPEKVSVGDTIAYRIKLTFPDNPVRWAFDSLFAPYAIGLKFLGMSVETESAQRGDSVVGTTSLSLKFTPTRSGHLMVKDGYLRLFHILQVDTAGDSIIAADTVVIKYPGFEVYARSHFGFPDMGVFALWLGSFIVILIVFGGIAKIVSTGKRKPLKVEKKVSPEEKALAELEAVSPARQSVREVAENISRILREYINARWQVPALSMASEEILKGLEDRGCSPHRLMTLEKILSECDDIRFAGKYVETQEIEKLVEMAKDFVQE